MALGVAARGYVLETGAIALQGTAAELAADPQVKRASLGGETPPPALRHPPRTR